MEQFFKAGESLLRSYFSQQEVKEFFQDRRCQWKFIPPGAPWQGGFYERMIGVVKKCLRKVLHNKRIIVDELRTLLVEIEARVNNRPLTYVHDNLDEPEPLTPNHLLQGASIETVPSIINKDYEKDPDFLVTMKKSTIKKLTSRFNHLNKLLKQWNRVWREDYLTSLREYHYGAKPGNKSSQLQVGDIVLIDCDNTRTSWPLGKIVELLPDKQGIVRVVKVLSKGNITLRTVEKLIPLEIQAATNDDTSLEVRPKRQAALNARIKMTRRNFTNKP